MNIAFASHEYPPDTGGGGIVRATLQTGEDRLVDGLGMDRLAQDHGAAGAAQGLVGGGGNHIGIGHRIGMGATGHQTGKMGHVHEQDAAGLVGNGPELGKIQLAGIGGVAGDQDLGLVLQGQAADLVIVQQAGRRIQAVVHGIEPLAGDAGLGTVGQVTTVAQVQTQDGVAGLGKGQVNGQIGWTAGIGLNVGMFGAKQLLGPFDSDELHRVTVHLALVKTGTGIAFGIFVLENGTASLQHGLGGVVFAGDQADSGLLVGLFSFDQIINGGIILLECAHGWLLKVDVCPDARQIRLKSALPRGAPRLRQSCGWGEVYQ